MNSLQTELSWALAKAQAPIVRTITQWVEDEIILPSGPFVGQRFKHHRHPASRLWFEAIDSGIYSRFAATGPTQNGKSLLCYVLPVLYHLLELGESVVIGLPSMDMANDKWQQDFKPVIEASNYRDLMPTRGEGSKNGQVKRSITFRNGATLRFISGGGSDKQAAGYTARVAAITETDGMDVAGESSREASRIEQIEARTRAWNRTDRRIYLECTVSIPSGRIWSEIKNSTDSRIARPCPYCHQYVTPEREHLVGWKECESEEQAAANAHWICPACSHPWTETDRTEAAKSAILLHRNQEIVDGEIVGAEPETTTLGLRWSAIDNPFTDASSLGAEEFLALRSADREGSEKKLRQFTWAIPYEPDEIDINPLDVEELRNREASTTKRGIIPDGSIVAVGIDTGKRELHWQATAIASDGSKVIIDYGIQTVESDTLGVLPALKKALKQLKGYFDNGWSNESGKRYKPAQVWIDSGYHAHTDAVYQFCAEANQGQETYRPAKGYGEGQNQAGQYNLPDARTKGLKHHGREYHLTAVRRNGRTLPGVTLVHINADVWKSEFHGGFVMPANEPGAIRLFSTADDYEHSDFIEQITAERQTEKWLPNRGAVIVWVRVNRNNHFLDASYLATAAADFVLSLVDAPVPRQRKTLSQLASNK